MRRPQEGGGNGPKGAGVQAEGLPVPDSNPWAMGLRLSFDPDPDLGILGGAQQCPLVSSLGVCDVAALDSLEICPVVQEPPVGEQQCPLFTTPWEPVPTASGCQIGG